LIAESKARLGSLFEEKKESMTAERTAMMRALQQKLLLLLVPSVLLLLLLHFRGGAAAVSASSFVVFPEQYNFGRRPIRSPSSTKSSSSLVSLRSSNDVEAKRQQQHQQQQQPQRPAPVPAPLQPVIIVDADNNNRGAIVTDTFKAATLALQTWQVLTGQAPLPSSPPAAPISQPPVYVVGSTTELQHVNQPVVLHFPMDASIAKMTTTMLTVPEMLQHPPSFVGLHVYCSNNDDALDSAQATGTVLQDMQRSVLPPSHGSPTAAACCVVSLDLELHLALLRINALPKDPNNAAHGDSYHVLMPDGGSLLLDYTLDYNDPFGGADPLKCPNTREMLIETPPTTPSLQRSRRLAAAYTAIRGQRRPAEGSGGGGSSSSANTGAPTAVSAWTAAVIAASVATILGDDDNSNNNNNGSSSVGDTVATTTTTWNMIQRAVQLSSHIRNYGSKEQVSGFMRQKYKEYGHK
jgi:hypothetical protein